MDFSHLTNEEVNYELALRHVRNLAQTTHRAKVLKLKALAQEDVIRETIHASSDHVMSPEDNIDTCQQQLEELRELVHNALVSQNKDVLSQSRSRLIHYRSRLAILKPPPALRDTKLILERTVNALLGDVGGAFPDRDQSVHSVREDTATSHRNDSAGEGNSRSRDDSGKRTPFRATSSPMTTGRGRGRVMRTPPDPRHSASGRIVDEKTEYTPLLRERSLPAPLPIPPVGEEDESSSSSVTNDRDADENARNELTKLRQEFLAWRSAERDRIRQEETERQEERKQYERRIREEREQYERRLREERQQLNQRQQENERLLRNTREQYERNLNEERRRHEQQLRDERQQLQQQQRQQQERQLQEE